MKLDGIIFNTYQWSAIKANLAIWRKWSGYAETVAMEIIVEEPDKVTHA